MLAVIALAAAVAAGPAPHRAVYVGAGFDTCQPPPTASMRAWLGSPYRAMNIYLGGSQLATVCKPTAELNTQWVNTVLRNGWSIIPTFVDLQPPCTGSTKKTFTAANARASGRDAADRAVNKMKLLGFGAGNPVYDDFEHYDESKAGCVAAAVDFVEAWTNRVHALGYTAGMYAVRDAGVAPIAQQANPRPDDIWWAGWDGNNKLDHPSLHGQWVGHRIHQYRGDHSETYNGIKLGIDNDEVHADVVGKITPPPDSAPYVYAASPPNDGTTLKERAGPSTSDAILQADSYGTTLTIQCQAVGETINGDFIWDRLTNGHYVSDIYTTTTGGLSFTRGVPRCDTTRPAVTLNAVPVATIRSAWTFAWSGSDVESGVGGYDLRYHKAKWSGGFASWKHLNGMTARQLALAIPAGDDLCVSVRSIDRSGNVSRWSPSRCIARPLDDRSLVTASTGWSRDNGKHFFLHTATTTMSARRGRELTRSGAHLDRVGVVATRCSTCGSVDVYVGTHLIGSISLQLSTARYHSIVMLPPFARRVGTVHVVTTSRSRKVQIDGLVISRT